MAEEKREEELEEIEEIEEVDERPYDDVVWGMKRSHFHGAGLGLAGGIILGGLMPELGIPWISATESGVVCAIVGFVLVWSIDKFFKKK